MGLEVDITIVDGDEDILVPEAGLNGVSSGQVGGGPVRSGNQKRAWAGVVIRGSGVCGGGVGWRKVCGWWWSRGGGRSSDGGECRGGNGFACGVESLAMGIEVAEGGGECERWIGKHEGGGESGCGREEAGTDGEKEGGCGGGAETSVGVEDECSVGDVADDGDGCGGEAD